MKDKHDKTWGKRHKLMNTIMILCVISFGISFLLKGELPSHEKIHEDLLVDPIQTETEEEPFSFEYRGETYEVIPLYDYDLRGVVVSHNNIHSIADIYHDKDSVDLKDICVVWGDTNLTSDDYREVKYWNISWSCNYHWKWEHQFDPDALSNNHLLTADESIQKKIRSLHKGDQFRLQGMLVSYHPKGKNYMSRNSSTVRTDHGNGACEVIYVEDLHVYKRSTPLFFLINYLSWRIFIFTFLLKLLFFFLESKSEHAQFEKRKKHLAYEHGNDIYDQFIDEG